MDNIKDISAPISATENHARLQDNQQDRSGSGSGDWKVSQDAIDRAKLDQAIHNEAAHSLFIDSLPANFKLAPSGPVMGPPRDSRQDAAPNEQPILKIDHEDQRFKKDDLEAQARDTMRQTEATGPLKGTPGYKPPDLFIDSKQHFIDDAEDKIFPGFGRLQSRNPNSEWRLDYLYSNRCKNSGPGLCFIMKMH